MSGVWEEIGAGREPERDLPPPRPSRRRRPQPGSAQAWARAHRVAATGLVVAAVLVAAGGRWAWQRTHAPPAAQALHVELDPSEYLLAGKIDGSGQAEVLLYLHVDVAPGFTQPVDLLRLEGGGVRVDSSHEVTGASEQFAVPANLDCDQWADGHGVRAVFQVGGGNGPGSAVTIPLDAGPNSPVHAQITAPCRVFAATHPLRLSAFAVTFQPVQPILESTWTLVNRAQKPLTLDPAGDTTVGGSQQLPLAVLPGGPADGPTVIAPGASISVTRRFVVTSCTNTADLDPNGASVRMVAAGAAAANGADGKAVVDLPDRFVVTLMNVSIDVCKGAPDPSGMSATLTFAPGPPGKGTGVLRVAGPVRLQGPWTARLVDPSDVHGALDVVSGTAVQGRQDASTVALAAQWTVGTCVQADLPDHPPAQVLVTVTVIRSYPFLLPVTVRGRTDCTPDDIQG
jgi:hypothetical protein